MIEKRWSSDTVEEVSTCPVCGDSQGKILYRDLMDNLFFCAPGQWNIVQCENCLSGYLTPRPKPEFIGSAYEVYYTHGDASPKSRIGAIRLAMANGYRNYRYGGNAKPSTRLGIIIALLSPAHRAIIQRRMRHLPRSEPGDLLLDVGCGSGDFMMMANSAGWETMGVDVDPKAIDIARKRDLNVRLGTIDCIDDMSGRFSGITLSHVLEHVHDPMHLLKTCKALIRPGGWLWVEVPNFDALGRKRFGRNWVGIDAPRHLTHFNLASLESMLNAAGFAHVAIQPYGDLCSSAYSSSAAIEAGAGILGKAGKRYYLKHRVSAFWDERRARRDSSVREFCTVKAFVHAP